MQLDRYVETERDTSSNTESRSIVPGIRGWWLNLRLNKCKLDYGKVHGQSFCMQVLHWTEKSAIGGS
jgi:hypothetical protein